MKLARLAFCVGMIAAMAGQAFAADSLHRNVSRKTGGEALEHRTDPRVYDINVEMEALDFKILIRSLSYLTSDGKSHAIALRDVAKTNAQLVADANGYFIVPGKSPVKFGLYDQQNDITAIRIQAESYGGSGSLSVSSINMTTKPGPQPQPQPRPQPVPDNGMEKQCSRDLPIVADQLRSCQANQDSAQGRLNRYDDDLRVARERLARSQGPLDACQRDSDNERARAQQLANDLDRARGDRAGLMQDLNGARQLQQEAANARSGRQYRCMVNGRHERFIGDGPSAAIALQIALARCGEGNCGKGDFSGQWSCVTQ